MFTCFPLNGRGEFTGECSPPKPSPQGGIGETRVPLFPTAVGSGWRPHRQGVGETRVPYVPRTASTPTGRGLGKPEFPIS